MSKEIGVGASLFLMKTKTLACLFLFIAILNIPVYAFFYTSSTSEVHDFQDYIAKLSMGSIGESSYACDNGYNYLEVKNGKAEKLTLSCRSKFSKM